MKFKENETEHPTDQSQSHFVIAALIPGRQCSRSATNQYNTALHMPEVLFSGSTQQSYASTNLHNHAQVIHM